ncbi:Biotin carboxyl carrier protein of acetyl-CoA carboxylase, chloroplastic [Glycine soja]|nr:Biotin carboxyl carrier protein of acetyl-CoA carboxylase, chloroplastic [Glycine soja]
MASSLAPATKAATNLRLTHSLRFSPKPNNLRFATKPGITLLCTRVKAQLNEVALDSSSNATSPPMKAKSKEEPPAKPLAEPSSSVLATQESVSQFITQVASLVKLVDSRDIVELKLKQHDVEVTIRKKEAMPQPPPAPVGDKVKKGQVVCIIEAMKLMNEIEVSSKVLYLFLLVTVD